MGKEATYDIYLCCANQEKDIQKASELNDYLSYQGYRVYFSVISMNLHAMESSSALLLYASQPESLIQEKLREEWKQYLTWIEEGKKKPNSFCLLLQGMNASSLPLPLRRFNYISLDNMNAMGSLNSFLKWIR